MSVHQQVLSVDNSIDRRVRWNHFVCPSTIPRGNVTCDGERERDIPRGTKRDRWVCTMVGIRMLDTHIRVSGL